MVASTGTIYDTVNAADIADNPNSSGFVLVDATNTYFYFYRTNSNGLTVTKRLVADGSVVATVTIDATDGILGGTFNISPDNTLLLGTYVVGGQKKAFTCSSALGSVHTWNISALYNSLNSKGRVIANDNAHAYMIEVAGGVRTFYGSNLPSGGDTATVITNNTTTPQMPLCVDKNGVLWAYNTVSQHLFTVSVTGAVYNSSTDQADLSGEGVLTTNPVYYNNADHTLSMMFGDSTSPTHFHTVKFDLATLTVLQRSNTIIDSNIQTASAIQHGQWRTDDKQTLIDILPPSAYLFDVAAGGAVNHPATFSTLGWNLSKASNFNSFVLQSFGVLILTTPVQKIWFGGTFGTLQDAGDVALAVVQWGALVTGKPFVNLTFTPRPAYITTPRGLLLPTNTGGV